MFKVGDIVECLRDRPYGAGINKGELAVIDSIDKAGNINFDNWPRQDYAWFGDSCDFKIYLVDLENK